MAAGVIDFATQGVVRVLHAHLCDRGLALGVSSSFTCSATVVAVVKVAASRIREVES